MDRRNKRALANPQLSPNIITDVTLPTIKAAYPVAVAAAVPAHQAAEEPSNTAATAASSHSTTATYIKPSSPLPKGDALSTLVEQSLLKMREQGKMGEALLDIPLTTLVDEVLFMIQQKPSKTSRAITPEARWAVAQSLCLSGKWQTPAAFALHQIKVREEQWKKEKAALNCSSSGTS
ncbi:MAG: hypothetical protein V4490_00260 [Pseudomonadota bacterium]